MPKLKLRNKFILYCAPLVLSIFLVGGYCIWAFSSIHNQLEKLQQETSPNAFATLEVKKLLLSLESGIKEKRIDKMQIINYIEQLKKIIASHPDHTAKVLGAAAKSSHDIVHHTIRSMSLSEYVLSQSEAGWQGTELSDVADMIHQELLSLGPVLDEHLKFHLEELSKTEAFVSQRYQQTLVFVILAGIAVFSFAGIMLVAMMRSVLGPVKILEERARQIGAGNLEGQMEISSGDEFEFLAQEFNKMACKLSEYHDSLDQKVQERTKELSDANIELQKAENHVHFLSQELLNVQETERQQISLDLHDNVAQELSSLKVSGDLVRDDVERGIQPSLEDIAGWGKHLDRCIKIVRDLSYSLRPPGLEQIGLTSALADYCRNYSKQTGIAVKFTKAGVDNLQLDFRYAIHLYRLVQEALNNIKKHAHASKVEIKLLASHPNIILLIEDDGHGFDVDEGYLHAKQNKRLGLLGMQERVRMLNGTFKIHSSLQEGTKIFVEFPQDKDNGNGNEQKNSDY